MLKSFRNFYKRTKPAQKANETFDSYIDRMKREYIVLNELIAAYKLETSKLLAPQIEKLLGRPLTIDEKQTLDFSIKAIKDGGDKKIEEFEGKRYYGGGGRRRKKKK